MHLAGQAHACDGVRVFGVERVDGLIGRLPPVGGILLGLAELRAVNGQGRARLSDPGASAVDQHGLDAGRADIHAEIHQVSSQDWRHVLRMGTLTSKTIVAMSVIGGGPPQANRARFPPGARPPSW